MTHAHVDNGHVEARSAKRAGFGRAGAWAVVTLCVATVGAMLAVVGAATTSGLTGAVEGAPPFADHAPATDERAADAYAKLPLSFEPNVGQADASTRFVSRGGGFALALAPDAGGAGPEPGFVTHRPRQPGAVHCRRQ